MFLYVRDWMAVAEWCRGRERDGGFARVTDGPGSAVVRCKSLQSCELNAAFPSVRLQWKQRGGRFTSPLPHWPCTGRQTHAAINAISTCRDFHWLFTNSWASTPRLEVYDRKKMLQCVNDETWMSSMTQTVSSVDKHFHPKHAICFFFSFIKQTPPVQPIRMIQPIRYFKSFVPFILFFIS